jgi:hypothetical protein
VKELIEAADKYLSIHDQQGRLPKPLSAGSSGIWHQSKTNHEFKDYILTQIYYEANRALDRNTTLAILFFTPVTPEHDICIDLGKDFISTPDGQLKSAKVYLTAQEIRQAIQRAIDRHGETFPNKDLNLRVILVTPSALTGGWVCRPWFMGSTTFSQKEDKERVMQVIAKSCGGAFADQLVRLFAEEDGEERSPLLPESERSMDRRNHLILPLPPRPSPEQISKFHNFKRQIHQTLSHKFNPLARNHGLLLSPDAVMDPSIWTDA